MLRPAALHTLPQLSAAEARLQDVKGRMGAAGSEAAELKRREAAVRREVGDLLRQAEVTEAKVGAYYHMSILVFMRFFMPLFTHGIGLPAPVPAPSQVAEPSYSLTTAVQLAWEAKEEARRNPRDLPLELKAAPTAACMAAGQAGAEKPRPRLWPSLTACHHQALAAVSPPSGASQNAWVYICPQTTKSMYHLVGMHRGCGLPLKPSPVTDHPLPFF
jgi:hypothetical protein